MPNMCLAAGPRLAVSILLTLIGSVPARGQLVIVNPYDAGGLGIWYASWDLRELDNSARLFPQRPMVSASPATVSADVLRHPLSSKARRLLQRAMHHADLGDHPAAIQGLREALAKDPSSAPYTHNLLGLEYMETSQFTDARSSFEEAARLMPHESANRSNLGLALAITGDWDSAEQEVRKAIQLDPANSKAKALLEMLLLHRHGKQARP